MKYLLNSLSLFCATRFESAYREEHSSKTTKFWLNRYVALRKRLPIMSDGNHWGNHTLSSKKPFCATQGLYIGKDGGRYWVN